MNITDKRHPLAARVFRRIQRIVDDKGLQAFVIGGFVRDYYLRRPSNDIDVVVIGSGIEVAEALGRDYTTLCVPQQTRSPSRRNAALPFRRS